MFFGRKVEAMVHLLDGRKYIGPTIEGEKQGLRDAVYAAILQTWVGEEGRGSLGGFCKSKGIRRLGE